MPFLPVANHIIKKVYNTVTTEAIAMILSNFYVFIGVLYIDQKGRDDIT